jgi:hypothetical protein
MQRTARSPGSAATVCTRMLPLHWMVRVWLGFAPLSPPELRPFNGGLPQDMWNARGPRGHPLLTGWAGTWNEINLSTLIVLPPGSLSITTRGNVGVLAVQ